MFPNCVLLFAPHMAASPVPDSDSVSSTAALVAAPAPQAPQLDNEPSATSPVPPPREPESKPEAAVATEMPTATAPTTFPWNMRLERDYIHCDVVQYTSTFQPLLAPYLSEEEFTSVLGHVNARLLELDRPTNATVMEGLLSWFTLGISDLFYGKPAFWKELDLLRAWIAERSKVWTLKGVTITDPKDTAWQFVGKWCFRGYFVTRC